MKLIFSAILLTTLIGLSIAQFTLPPDFTLPPPDKIWPKVAHKVPGYATLVGGKANSWYTGRNYTFFHGLPYTKPTTNATRFLPPEPYEPFDDDEVIDAWTLNPKCAQRSGVENCQTLNIFTPNLPVNATNENEITDLLPVMYWIHGGGFETGETKIYTGFKYMEHDVVVVEVQYRLGAFGFLCLDIDEVPGNAGIFDQIEGLKWVQKYIKFFRGDPNRVTIFGESAGGTSVHLLMFAPQAKGLFHGVIGQSGSMLSDWALDRKGAIHGRRIAELAGCPLEPKDALVECLRFLPPETLYTAQGEFKREDMKNGGNGFGGASPVMQVAGADRLLTDEPGALMDAGNYTTDVPIMFGANQQEGIFVMGEILNGYIRPNDLEFNEEFFTYDFIPIFMKSLGIRDDTGALGDAIVDKYFEGFPLGNFTEMLPAMIDAAGVFFLKAGGWSTVIKHSKHNPGNAYWYSYDFRSRFSILGSTPPIPQGINHADELQGLIVTPFLFNETENFLSKQMLQVWTNFATYGNPTPDGVEMLGGIPKFLPYNNETQPYMSINQEWRVQYDYTKTYRVMGDWYRPQENSTETSPIPDSTIPTTTTSTTRLTTPSATNPSSSTPPTTTPPTTTTPTTVKPTTDIAVGQLPSQALLVFFIVIGTLFM